MKLRYRSMVMLAVITLLMSVAVAAFATESRSRTVSTRISPDQCRIDEYIDIYSHSVPQEFIQTHYVGWDVVDC